jgi:outer membrane protein OmpA-like peptidoglycan-associated protein
MRINPGAVAMAAFIVGAVGLSGCATKGFVRQNVAVVDQKVTADRSRMDTMDQATRDAMARAEAAGKLAEGKFLYSMVLSDDSVKFPLDSSQLSPEAQTRLADFVQKLKADNKNVYLEIQGHTDSSGTKDLNMRLGEERAEAVRRYMNQQGVPLNRMSTISYGQDDPVAPNDTRQGRAQNRRVVLIVMA